tara:strand:+ start:121 stop:525 length:405 start_codon:yes stop_codon:yes gene_type:complete
MCKPPTTPDIVSFDQQDTDDERETEWYDYLEDIMNDYQSSFSISLDSEEYGENRIISNEPFIVLKNTKCIVCSRWNDNLRDHYHIANNDGNGITTKSILMDLIIYNFSANCNHMFLEGIRQIDDTNVYELEFGS